MSEAALQRTLSPFGEISTEDELAVLGIDQYQESYFIDAPFNKAAMQSRTFLIVGRRGSGKTALTRYFAFQRTLKNAHAIDVDEPSVYQKIEAEVVQLVGYQPSVIVPQLARIWEHVLWQVVFREMRTHDPRIADACVVDTEDTGPAAFIFRLFGRVLDFFKKGGGAVTEEFAVFVEPKLAEAARAAVLEIARRKPVILAIDTLENYSVRTEAVVWSIASLIQCTSQFNARYSSQGLHVKLFVMGEAFPFLMEEGVSNFSKYVRDELYLHWKPKDLLRLLSWRFAQYLERHKMLRSSGKVSDWKDYEEVFAKLWTPFFGESIQTYNDHSERSFPYVLRHTQLRPRQLVIACNAIAARAMIDGSFPYFSAEHVRSGLRDAEIKLATEVFNSFKEVYPHAGQIAEALLNLPVRFSGSVLDQRAPNTAAHWPPQEYSALRFAQVVAEMGVVGRVRGNPPDDAISVEADFEYFLRQRCTLLPHHQCVIHPMFFARLAIASRKTDPKIYPFPDHEDFSDVSPSDHDGKR